MKYLNSAFFRWQLVGQAFLIILNLILPDTISTLLFDGLAIILLVLIGIPHGANDLFYRKDGSTAGVIRFLSSYVGVMVLYGLMWWFLPVGALALFLLISIHHFGQSNFEQQQLWYLPSILWGCLLIFAPILLHWEIALKIFSDMIGRPIESSIALEWIYGAGIIGSLFYALVIWRKYSSHTAILLILQWVLVMTWLYMSPLLSGFIIVFTFWHSGQSLHFQWRAIQSRLAQQPCGKNELWWTWGGTSVASFAFLGMIHWIWGLSLPLLFILLSLITLPHVLVMHELYQKQETTKAIHQTSG